MAQQQAYSKASAEQEISSSASYSELKDASLSDDDIMIFEVELNAFALMLQSVESPNKRPNRSRPTTYIGYSDQTKRCRNSEMNLYSQVTGQTLFNVWGLDNSLDTPPQPLIRPYKKVDRSEGAILEALKTICDVCGDIKKT